MSHSSPRIQKLHAEADPKDCVWRKALHVNVQLENALQHLEKRWQSHVGFQTLLERHVTDSRHLRKPVRPCAIVGSRRLRLRQMKVYSVHLVVQHLHGLGVGGG